MEYNNQVMCGDADVVILFSLRLLLIVAALSGADIGLTHLYWVMIFHA